jgi:hypothetical protein
LILPSALQKNAVHKETVTQNGELNSGIIAIYTKLVCICLSILAVTPQVTQVKRMEPDVKPVAPTLISQSALWAAETLKTVSGG